MEGRSLLISDLDNTLLGDDDALDEFVDWYQTVRDRLLLVYNSGRLIWSIERVIGETALPAPHAMIGGVGTEIVLTDTGERLPTWPRNAHRFSAEVVRDVLLAECSLRPQDQENQSPYKVSFFGEDLSEEFLAALHLRLAEHGLDVELVYSSRRDLDVLPAQTNKGSAAAHLAAHWEVEHQHVVVSGDSGNDLTMFAHGFRGVVVDNAHPELKALDSRHVYHAPSPYAAGVLDGLKYWLDRSEVAGAL